MKKYYYGLLSLGMLVSACTQQNNDITIMSYNIHNGIGLDEERDHDRIAQIINTANPDIVALQEVDSMTIRSGQSYVLGDIAKRCGMKAYFAPAINFDGGKYGIGILSREEPLNVTRKSLPGREEMRTCIIAEFDKYIFCCTHLSLNYDDRIADIDIISSLTASADKPVFIAGDLNAHPDSPEIDLLRKNFQIISDTTSSTFPSDCPVETLDYIGINNKAYSQISALSTTVIPDSIASDHRPITVTFSLK